MGSCPGGESSGGSCPAESCPSTIIMNKSHTKYQ